MVKELQQSLKKLSPSHSLDDHEKAIKFENLDELFSQNLRDYFEQNSENKSPIAFYFNSIVPKLLIQIEPAHHQITLSFALKPWGKSFTPIKELSSHPSSLLLRAKRATEYTIEFAEVCDLKEISCAVALEYSQLGYHCSIQFQGQTLDFQQILAEAKPEILTRRPVKEVASCA
ncbi:MAG: hypothetical protein MH252_04695 [Thermosynechococcaceae cyanobacterium MS004]|nr:hypothetical protein [Thermosynechococcaceae cyanobacterium MS004]